MQTSAAAAALDALLPPARVADAEAAAIAAKEAVKKAKAVRDCLGFVSAVVER